MAELHITSLRRVVAQSLVPFMLGLGMRPEIALAAGADGPKKLATEAPLQNGAESSEFFKRDPVTSQRGSLFWLPRRSECAAKTCVKRARFGKIRCRRWRCA